MSLKLHPTYRNRTSTGDRHGACLIDLMDALVSTGHWQRHGAGDGGSVVTTTLGVNIFTGNGGLGYQTSTALWGAVQANTISSPRAWARMREIISGVPTGREIMFQRSSSTSATGCNPIIVGITATGYSGTPTANTPYPSGTGRQLWNGAAFNGTGLTIMSTLGVAPQPTSGNTYIWNIWVDDGTLCPGNVSPFAVSFHDSTASQKGFGWMYLGFRSDTVAAGDTQPWAMTVNTWDQTFGGDNIGTPASAYATGPSAWIYNSNVSTDRMWTYHVGTATYQNVIGSYYGVDTSGDTIPGNNVITSVLGGDLDGNKALFPINTFMLNGSNRQRKGTLESIHIRYAANNSDIFPVTLNADVAQAIPPRIVMGSVTLPWEVGVVPVWATNTNLNANVELWPKVVAPTPDTTPPVLGAFTPPPGAIAYDVPVAIPITDVGSGISALFVSIDYDTPDAHEVAIYGVETGDIDDAYATASNLTPIANGLTVSVLRNGGWRGPFTFRLRAIDGSGNESVKEGAFTISTDPNPAAPDTSPPIVGPFAPASGTAIEYDKAILCAVFDSRGMSFYVVSVVLGAGLPPEVVWDGEELSEAYSGSDCPEYGVARILRDGGWPSDFELRFVATDRAGFVTRKSAFFTIATSPNPAAPDTDPPIVELVSPTSLANLGRHSPFVLALSDNRGIESFAVYAIFPELSIFDLVIDGGDLDLKTNYKVSYATVSGKQHAEIIRRGGWPLRVDGERAEGFIRVRAIDARGNQT